MMRRIASPAGICPDDPVRTMRHRHLAIAGIAIAAILIPVVHHPTLRLVWNASASVPLGLYRIVAAASPHAGDMIVVRPSARLARFMAERRYVEAGVPLVKPIAGAVGDRICRHGSAVTIDGRHAATALDADRFGRPLPRWTGCYRLGRDQFFLIAPISPASFDSRYFGPVTRDQIIGRALPVWTWR